MQAARKLASDLHEQLSKSPESINNVEPRLTFLFPLERERKAALEILRVHNSNDNIEQTSWSLSDREKQTCIQMLDNEDFVMREAGLFLLLKSTKAEKWSDSDIERLVFLSEKMIKSEDPRIRRDAVRVLGYCKERGMSQLAFLMNDTDLGVRFIVVRALAKLGTPESFPFLAPAAKDESETVRMELARGLSHYGDQAMPLLHQMLKDSQTGDSNSGLEQQVQENIAQSLLLIELNKRTPVEAADYLKGKIGEYDRKEFINMFYALLDLKGEKRTFIESVIMKDDVSKRFHDEYKIFSQLEEVMTTQNDKRKTGIRSHQMWLLSSQKPLFATGSTEVLTERLKSLDEKVTQLREKFKEQFIGIVIWGSTAGGYIKTGSDLDATVITQSEQAAKEAGSIFHRDVFSPTLVLEEGQPPNKKFGANLFEGIFFGDYKRLTQLQKELLDNVTDQEWDTIRKEIYQKNITNLTQGRYAQERLGVVAEELDVLQLAVALTRVPPSKSKASRIVQKRLARDSR